MREKEQHPSYDELDLGEFTAHFGVLSADDEDFLTPPVEEEKSSPAEPPAAPEEDSASLEELWDHAEHTAPPAEPEEEEPAFVPPQEIFDPPAEEPVKSTSAYWEESEAPAEPGHDFFSHEETEESEEPEEDEEDYDDDTPRLLDRVAAFFARRMPPSPEELEESHPPKAEESQETTSHSPEIPHPAAPASSASAEGPISVATVVASTVDAVMEERKDDQRRYQEQRKKTQKEQEKIHRSNSDRAMDTVDLSGEEPSLVEATVRQKRLQKRLRKNAVAATVLALLSWVPALVEAFGVVIPYYSTMPLVRSVTSAVLLGAVCIAGFPVFVAGFTRRRLNCFTLVSVGAVVTLADTATMTVMADRWNAAPFSAISAAAVAFALWGECWKVGALREGFRLVALGQPAYVVDLTTNGAVKQHGSSVTFYNRTVREDVAARWQHLLLPVVFVGSLVFALLASVGQGKGQNFLWCWSAILTAGSALALPFVYSLPYLRIAKRMGISGSAVAGFYGAQQLSYSKEILVTDQDLFPPGTIRLGTPKIISEDRRKAASYAGSLAIAYDCGWSRLFSSYMVNERGRREHLEHFHIHDEGGVSASIYGETTILGTAPLLRRMSVRLPKSLERKNALYLSIDGELVAIYPLDYKPADSVGWALHAMHRNGITPLFITRDPNLTLRGIKSFFGTDGGGLMLDLNERLNLSAEKAEDLRPNALLYREGLAPYMEAVAGSKRLCRAVRWGNTITLLGSVAGTLLSFYLMFVDRISLLTPGQLMLFLLLWTLPVFLLAWNTDHL